MQCGYSELTICKVSVTRGGLEQGRSKLFQDGVAEVYIPHVVSRELTKKNSDARRPF